VKKSTEMQRLIQLYREETGEQSVNMHDVAEFAMGKGWPMPKPKSPTDLLAEQFSKAAREEYRRDEVTGRPYRANLAVVENQGKLGEQYTLWTDIDAAPKAVVKKSVQQRREQMVGDAVHLADDVDHWNRVNPNESPITLELDFGPDVEWRRNAPDEEEKAA
jgi:hypothetical protein